MKKLQLTLIVSLAVASSSFSLAHAKLQTPVYVAQTTQQEETKNDNQAKLELEAKKPLMFCKGFPLCHVTGIGGNKEEVQPNELFNKPTNKS